VRAFYTAIVVLLLCFPDAAAAQDPSFLYYLSYDLSTPSLVHVSVGLSPPASAPITLIMPRTVPGGYAQHPYDPFVANVKGYAATATSASLEVQRDQFGPRWKIGKNGEKVARVEYDVDVAQMEREIFDASAASKVREGYVGLLGYSIFAFFDGWEDRPIGLEVSAPKAWPVFSTLAPRVPAETDALAAQAADYYELADSQITMGPKVQLRQIDGQVPLFLSVYAECDEDLVQEGALARDALDKLVAYFGSAPFSAYTVDLELLRPLPAPHEYNFSMEHLNSGTFFFDTQHALTAKSSEGDRETHRFNYAHHIAHSWIPKRAYGPGYLPFTWEMTPLIDTIWFNEGFGRYVAIEALAEALPKTDAERYRREKLDRLRAILDSAPDILKRMSLPDLSREGSFLYSDDFRLGMSVFSRGALMAAEMDDQIRTQSSGQKSLRDALRHLMEWSRQNHHAFRTEDLPVIFWEATGVDTSVILNRWMQPPLR
jgi:predicted metalloprotease with PDZ domain